MNNVLYNDIEFDKYVESIIDQEDISSEDKYNLLQAKIENEMSSKEKIDNMIYYTTRLNSENVDDYNRIEFLESRIDKRKNKVKYILDSILNYLQIKGFDKIESDFHKLKLCKCPESVNIINEELIPIEYKNLETKLKVDKIRIKEALNKNIKIEGVELIKDKKRLDIK